MEYDLLDIRTLSDPKEDGAALIGIPQGRREYILQYRFPEDRKRSLGAWRLMETMFARHGFSANDVKMGGKGKLTCEGICFNLSHSGDMALCAISDTPVGCDIEQIRKAPLNVARRMFTARERAYLEAAQGEENRRFFRLWTMKESYLKMTGEGLGVPLQRVEVNPETGSVLRNSALQPCKIQNISLEDYEISICCTPVSR